MLGPFEDYDDWLNFYTQQKDSPAMLRECETGGRYLHWIGYRWIEVHNVLVLEITNNLLTSCFKWWMIGVKLHLRQCLTFTTSIQPNNWTLKHGDQGNQTQRIQINVWSPTWDWSPMLPGQYCISTIDQHSLSSYVQVWLCLRADRLAVGNVHGLLPPCHIYYWEQLCYCKGAVLQNQIWHSVWGDLLYIIGPETCSCRFQYVKK